jgi:hypothetical protein
MRIGIVGFSLFVGGGLAYVFGLNTYFGLGFSLIIFILWRKNDNFKEEEDG